MKSSDVQLASSLNATRATRRDWLGLVVLALPTLLLSLDVSVLFLASGGVAAVVVGLTLAGLGISPAMALTMNLMLGSTPPEKAGSAASISETSGEFGVALGIAALGSLATIAYRAHLTIPAGTPTDADHAARQGITAAASAARHLPGALGADLLDSARTAFTAGLTTVASVGAAVFVGLAVLAAVAFRRVPATGTAPEVRVDADEAPAAVTAAA
jgi:MFS transporter, DHA2 family, multidrug resistance protein